MNRALVILNAFGVLVLGALCFVQWRAEKRLHLDVGALKKTNWEQSAKLTESAASLKGAAADLESFREQIVRLNKNLNDEKAQLAGLEHQLRQVSAERDLLKSKLNEWQRAVAERDSRLKEANTQIQTLAADRNAAVVRYNELATKYNTAVKNLNAAITRLNEIAEARKKTTDKEPKKETP